MLWINLKNPNFKLPCYIVYKQWPGPSFYCFIRDCKWKCGNKNFVKNENCLQCSKLVKDWGNKYGNSIRCSWEFKLLQSFREGFLCLREVKSVAILCLLGEVIFLFSYVASEQNNDNDNNSLLMEHLLCVKQFCLILSSL